MKIRQLAKSILAVTMIAVLLIAAACSNGNNEASISPSASPAPSESPSAASTELAASETTPAVEEDRTPVTIKFANWANSETYTKVMEAFTKKYPWIKVEFVYTGEKGIKTLMEESVAAGAPIDVFFDGNMDNARNDDLAEPLDAYIANDPEFQKYNFLPGIMEQFNIKGRQLALPRGTEAFLVYYNKDLLEEYGLEKPSYDWTWEDLRQMAIQATDPATQRYGLGGDGIVYIFGSPALPMANGHAANIYGLNETLTKSLMDQPEVMDDMQWFANLIAQDKVLLDKQASEAAGIKEDRWTSGNALFTIHVSALMETWDTALKFNWDVLPIPKGTARQVGLMWNQPLIMTKASKHKDAVWKFMSFYTTSPEAQAIFYEKATLLPNTTDADMKTVLSGSAFYDKYDIDAIMHAVATAVPDPTSYMAGGGAVAGVHNEWAVNKLFNERMSPYDYFPAAVEKLNKDIAEAQAKFE